MAKNGTTVTKDNVDKVLKSIQDLVGRVVMVGVPSENADREESDREESGGPNNAMIAYVQETGAPELGIPARPFLVPGVKEAQAEIATCLRGGAEALLSSDEGRATSALSAAGMTAVSSVRRVIQNGDFEALKPATIAARARARGTASRRKSEKKYLQMVSDGIAPDQAQDAAGIRPLVNTGQMRNSVTYVLRRRTK